jgi:hypothetical protein
MKEWSVGVICTDGGQHQRTRLATVDGIRHPDGTISKHIDGGPVDSSLKSWHEPDPTAEPGSVVSRDSYGFYCHRCGRNPKLTPDKFWTLIQRVVTETTLTDVDLSRLPLQARNVPPPAVSRAR